VKNVQKLYIRRERNADCLSHWLFYSRVIGRADDDLVDSGREKERPLPLLHRRPVCHSSGVYDVGNEDFIMNYSLANSCEHLANRLVDLAEIIDEGTMKDSDEFVYALWEIERSVETAIRLAKEV
jgi:hypothetical protein